MAVVSVANTPERRDSSSCGGVLECGLRGTSEKASLKVTATLSTRTKPPTFLKTARLRCDSFRQFTSAC